MASTKAQLAKDKGNEAFKAGDFPTAIGHYTSAILANRDDPTFPLNRAAAYLKLGKYEDAERDCTTVVKMNPSNVKGLFRRAQARMGQNKLADAQKDLKDALMLEPMNDAVKQDLKKVEDLLSKEKAKGVGKAAAAAATPSQSTSISPDRRRIPIRIIEPTTGSSTTKTRPNPVVSQPSIPGLPAKNDLMKPVSSRSLALSDTSSTNSKSNLVSSPTVGSVSLTPSSVPTPKPSTFQDAKQARESAKPSRVGGGIFRPSGDHTIVGNGDKANAQPSFTATPPPLNPIGQKIPAPNGALSTKPPMTLFNFMRTWESSNSVQERWSLISQIPPSTLPALFQNSLEASLVASILDTFQRKLHMITDPEDRDRLRMRVYMASFAKVPRFKTVVLFMSKTEKELAKEVWEKLGVRNGGASWGLN